MWVSLSSLCLVLRPECETMTNNYGPLNGASSQLTSCLEDWSGGVSSYRSSSQFHLKDRNEWPPGNESALHFNQPDVDQWTHHHHVFHNSETTWQFLHLTSILCCCDFFYSLTFIIIKFTTILCSLVGWSVVGSRFIMNTLRTRPQILISVMKRSWPSNRV